MEIEFEPVFDMDGPAPNMLADMLPFAQPASSSGLDGASGGGNAEREGNLDRFMAGLMDGSVPVDAGDKGSKTRKWSSPDGSKQIFIQAMPASVSRSRVPVDLLRNLFPGPLLIDQEASDPRQNLPFGDPDPLVMDMLQGMNRAFHDDLLPTVHRASGAAPRSCHDDLRKHCSKTRSQVHCLGQHQDDISEACRKDVGKSVPFLCSTAIDMFCDVLQTGILSCLEKHLNQDVNDQCKDAVVATRHVISKANTQKASVKVKSPQSTSQPAAASLRASPQSASSEPQQGPGKQQVANADNSLKLLETTADLVAEATGNFKHSHEEAASTPWGILLSMVVLAAAIYACTVMDGSQRVYSAFKPYMHVDEDSKPLRDGVQLRKPLAI